MLQTIILNLLKAERDESPEGDMDEAETQADTLKESWGKISTSAVCPLSSIIT